MYTKDDLIKEKKLLQYIWRKEGKKKKKNNEQK